MNFQFTTILFVACALAAACNNDPPASSSSVGADASTDIGDVGVDATSDAGDAADAADAPPDAVPDANPDATGDVVPDLADVVDFPTVIVAVETRVSATGLRAGDSVFVSCDAIDEDGELVAWPDGVTENWLIAPDAGLVPGEADDELIAAQAGNASIACMVPQLSLIDTTPVDLVITPGDPFTIITEVDRITMTAGDTATVSCSAYDEYGNYIEEPELDLLIAPFGDGVEVFEPRVIITRSGLYEFTCSADSAANLISELVEVVPALPASLAVGVTPDRALYTIGEVVSLIWTVSDEYGNLVESPPVRFSSVPLVPSFGEGRFRFEDEGIFRLTVFVARPTATGEPLVGSVELVVNETGPTISCGSPTYGEMINAEPGSTIFFTGQTGDEFGVAEVLVNGEPAFIRPDNSFAIEMEAEFGVNFAEVVATDELGATSSRSCAFLAANQWIPENAFFDDDIALTMAQDAFDDGVPTDGLDSLNDIIHTMLNSSEVVTQIDSALDSANPIYPSTCVLDSWFGCIVRVGVTYEWFELRGPNNSSLNLTAGGLQIGATVRGIRVGLRISGTFGTSGWISLSSMSINMTFDIALSGGRPRVTLRRLDGVEVGGIDSDFSGITGFVLDIVIDIFEDDIRDLIRDQIQDFIRGEVNDILDDTISGLDIESLGDTISVPRLDSDETLDVGFGIRFSTIAVSPSRALFGLGSRFTAPISHGGGTLGAAQPPGAVLDDAPPERSVKVAMNLGLLNQVMHTLWRGGLFDAAIGGDTLSDGVPSDAAAILYANLPPLVVGQDGGGVEVHFGGLRAQVVYPSLLADPIIVHVGAKIRTGVDLVGDDEIDFRDIVLTDFYFDPLDAGIDASTRETLETFLEETIQYVLDESLNSALPNFPIPSFELPVSVSDFGLPGGAYLGILEPVLEINPRHFVLGGNFGTR